ncbi:hypothetical protein BGZ98_005073 [Dissophora globulifera]|nr:hypothetical protein BGZ98_005073 [Dissophora globulifera]
MAVLEQASVSSVEGQGPPAGTPIRSFLLTDESSPGMACQIATLGATLTHLWVPDNKNQTRDVVLGFDDLRLFRSKPDPYFGASVGRTANRIAQGRFSLPDDPSVVYTLAQNNGPNSLHGGIDGLSYRNWDVVALADTPDKSARPGSSLRLTTVSDHMDQGFPGRLRVYCTYRILNSTLEIAYEAHLESREGGTAHETTIASLTNHAYFNLNGVPSLETPNGSSTALVINHVLAMPTIASYLETDSTSVPTGTVVPLDQAPAMDFRTPKRIGDHLHQTPGDGRGYDHFYVAPATTNQSAQVGQQAGPAPLVDVYSPDSGIRMVMATTEPGFQLYTANWLQIEPNQFDTGASDHSAAGHGFPHVGKARGGYERYSGFCLEASRFPDAINHPEWRDQVLLRHGEKYQSTTTFKFSTK